MKLKTQLVIIGVVLFLIVPSLDFLFNVFTADEQAVTGMWKDTLLVIWEMRTLN